MPCRDVAAYAGAAIASLRAQSFTDFEVICIDDGSVDGTGDVLRAAISGDTRFQIVTNAPARGLSVARNIGLARARGAQIAFLDGDDRYMPEFLARMSAALLASGGDWVACAISLVWPDGTSQRHCAIHGRTDIQATSLPLDDARDVARIFPSVWNKLYKRDFIGATRFVEGALFEDHPFFWELACKTRTIGYVPEPLYLHLRGRAGQITAQAGAAAFQKLVRVQEVAAILARSDKSAQPAALSQLATRLVHERLQVIEDSALRTSFLDRAAELFAALELRWDRAGAADIDPAVAPWLDPEMRLSVLALGDKPQLDDQLLPVWQVIPTQDIGRAVAQVTSPWVAILCAHDLPVPQWALHLLEAAQEGDVVLCGAHVGGAEVTAQAACLPGMVMLRTDVLRALVIPDMPDAALGVWLVHALRAQGLPAITIAETLIQIPTPAPVRLRDLARFARRLPPDTAADVFAHCAFVQQLGQSRAVRLWQALNAGALRLIYGLARPSHAAHMGRALRLGLWMRAPCVSTGKRVRHTP